MTVHNLIMDQLKISKENQKSHADRNYTPKQFNVGERVMLSTQNLKLSNQPSKKNAFSLYWSLYNNRKNIFSCLQT